MDSPGHELCLTYLCVPNTYHSAWHLSHSVNTEGTNEDTNQNTPGTSALRLNNAWMTGVYLKHDTKYLTDPEWTK